MSRDDLLYSVAKLIVLGLVVHIFVLAYVFYSGYEGRQDLVDSQRAGCERGKLDRKAAATVNDNVQKIFRASQANLPDIQSSERVVALGEIEKVNQGLRERAAIVCAEAFPKASFIP